MVDFFIVGAPKCGTTALAQYLSEHKQVLIPNIKEPHYYATDMDFRQVTRLSSYERLFSGKEKYKICGEASVWYLYSKEAIVNILDDNPNAKFIVMLRNPVEMIASLHEQAVFSGAEHVKDLKDAWELSEKRRLGQYIKATGVNPFTLDYKSTSLLGEHIQLMLQHVPMKNMLFVSQKQFSIDTLGVYQDVLRFLEVNYDGRVEFRRVNVAKEPRSLIITRFVRLLSLIKRKAGIENSFGFVRIIVDLNRKERQREGISEELENIICEYTKDDVDLVYKLTGIKL